MKTFEEAFDVLTKKRKDHPESLDADIEDFDKLIDHEGFRGQIMRLADCNRICTARQILEDPNDASIEFNTLCSHLHSAFDLGFFIASEMYRPDLPDATLEKEKNLQYDNSRHTDA